MPSEDEVFPDEEQPLPAAVSPTTDSPGYVSKSDSEEDPEEDPANEEDDGDDEDESSDDDEDDDVDIEGDEEEEEHPSPTDTTTIALPAVDHAPSAAETEPLMSLRPQHHHILHNALLLGCRSEMSHLHHFGLRQIIARLLAIPLPPPSLLSPWSSPLPQVPSPPLLVSSPLRAEAPSTSHPLPLPSPIVLPRTRTSVAMMRAAAPYTYILVSRLEAPPSGTPPLLPIPLATPSPPLLLPFTDSRADSSFAPTVRPDGDFRRDYGFIATLDDEIMQDPERDVGYGITDTWDEMLVGMPGAPVTNETELGRWVTDLVMTVRQDTDEIYKRLDDAQTERQMVTGWVNMLFRDRRAHARITRLMDIDARMSREAWGPSMDASNLACTKVMTLRTQVVAQWSKIAEL
ncbi:hypothetical protein Tco_0377058 [Tanacetum coccineum]